MNILMMTNTYLPHVGGVARSIDRFSRRYRSLGHHVQIVAPEFDGMPASEPEVIRVPAVRHFNRTDFSVALPVPRKLESRLQAFKPDVVHSHHPFLVGGTALRVAHTHDLPLVFTHHTRYEDYTHYVPGDSALMKRFVKNLATNYANMCDQVFAPSESVANLLRERGVTTAIDVVPTGVEVDLFADGDGVGFRQSLGISTDDFVVGHLGRLTEEKNIPFLVKAIIQFMQTSGGDRQTHCLIIGSGPLKPEIESLFARANLSDRLHFAGVLGEERLADAYHAMDVFAFASTTETQGMVLTEAMASAIPVVAVDAPGVREAVGDQRNGYLLNSLDVNDFADALSKIADADKVEYERLSQGARQTASEFSMENTAKTALELYKRLKSYHSGDRLDDYSAWTNTLQVLESEWEIMASTARSVIDAFDTQEK